MLHSDRVWCVMQVAGAEELARNLTDGTWTCCTGFELEGYLWLNDSTCPDGAQEYAILKKVGPEGRLFQIESITFSWCNFAEALEYVQQALRGVGDRNDLAGEVFPVLQSPAEHGRCCHCL
jgi:hypothetical protein